MKTTYETFSSKETKDLGDEFAKGTILKSSAYESKERPRVLKKKNAFVVLLFGDLGSGKTTFTQGIFRGLGIKRNPISPTFVIMRHYKMPRARRSSFADIYHFDAYRLKKTEDLEILGFDDLLLNPKNVIIVEWPELIERMLPKRATKAMFDYGKNDNERKIIIK